ncbi:MAG: hypothetical protein IJ272_09450 [Clostridia bacterium]|nr:hypothetical protein [Clostridia bacterium]
MNRANIIAKTELLTEEILLREVFGICQNTYSIRKKKKLVLQQLKELLAELDERHCIDKKFVIYCFIRLWEEGEVYNYDFKSAFLRRIYSVLIRYGDWYAENKINEIQESLIVV